MEDYNNYQTHAQDVNVEQYTNDSALRLRLDTAELKYKLQMFMEGKQEQLQQTTTGCLITKATNKGNPMANEIGIQRIMAFFETVVNSQVVQGNLDENQYGWFMMRIRQDLTKHLFINLYNYDIKDSEYGLIIDMVANSIELFISRTKNNEERKGYANFMSHFENSSALQGQRKEGGLWDKFKIGK